MIFFGWNKSINKDFGPCLPRICPRCNNEVNFHLFRQSLWFTLYFIPIFPHLWQNYLLCPICQHGNRVKGRQVHQFKKLAKLVHGHGTEILSDEEFKQQYADIITEIEEGNKTSLKEKIT